MIAMYKTFVRSRLEYCSSVWSPALKTLSTDLEKVQRSFTKYLPGLFDMEHHQREKLVGLDTLESRRMVNDMVVVYKLVNGLFVGIDSANFFAFARSSNRGHSCKLFKPSASHSARINFFSFRVIDVWNSLPESIISIKSVKLFRKRCTDHLRRTIAE